MITAVDTSVLLDVLTGDQRHGPASAAALREAMGEGALLASSVVWAETAGAFDDSAAALTALERLGVEFVADDLQIATSAGRVYRAYRRAGGTRRRILPDFLIGAHALVRADRLLTRDPGFYRSHFARLKVFEP